MIVMLFMLASLGVVTGLVGPVVRASQNSAELLTANRNYYAVEAGTEDVLYRLLSGKTVSNTENLTIDNTTVVTTITDSLGGKTVNTVGSNNNTVRKVEARVSTGEGVAFTYAMQAGNGGFDISGGSTINGNVYANGNITGNSGTITGHATAANSAPLVADQANASPATPSNNLIFGNSSGTQDLAQSFQVANTAPLNKVRFYLQRTATAPGNLTIRLVSDNNGSPASNTVDSVTLVASSVPTAYGWVEVSFSGYVQLEAGTTYWLVLDGGNNSTRYYTIGANNTYASGVAKTGQFNGSWGNTSPSGLDAYFEVYTGGLTSQIFGTGGSQWYQPLAVNGDSWAHTVSQTNTSGTIYCQVGIYNAGGKTCNTSRPDPTPQGFTIGDNQIQGWKDDVTSALTGGWTYYGNLTIGWQGTTTTALRRVEGNLTVNGGGVADLGALEVTGNVTVSGGGRLKAGPLKVGGALNVGSNGFTIEDTVWVVGNIVVSSGASISLDSSYGSDSGVVVSDGRLDLTGGGVFSGSGTTGSYPIVVTTSRCPADASCSGANAITQSGGSGAVVLVAPYGTLSASGGTSARAMTAYKVMISGGGSVTYDSGLADISLSSGPSGGFNIESWKEVE